MTGTYEYLLFNAVVAGSILISSSLVNTPFRLRWPRAALATALVAVPYLVWDSWVAGRHWTFNSSYTSGVALWGLPLGEWMFFASVGMACLFVWETVWRPIRSVPVVAPGRWWSAAGLAGAALAAWWGGFEYTALATGSVSVAMVVDRWAGTHLFRQRAFLGQLVTIVVFVVAFDGYLAGRPVVLYGDGYYLGWRIGYVPVEDFAYAIGWLGLVHIAYMRLTPEALSLADQRLITEQRRRWFGAVIRRRLRGYRERFSAEQVQRHVTELSGLPVQSLAIPAGRRPRIAVVGGGLAGLQASLTLAARGVDVELFERESYLGGKVGAWPTTLPGGETQTVEHGFHAFFRHYYNLYRLLDECGVTPILREMPDYLIATKDGRRFGYAQIATTPLVNLVSLLLHGHFHWRDLARPRLWRLVELLRYESRQTAERFDHVSYAQFADDIDLPDELRLTFNSFARAFFAPPERMSTAELLKSFHFFFLSHDHGLCYDYLPTDYHTGLIGPITERLGQLGVKVHTNAEVAPLRRGTTGFRVRADGQDRDFDGVVLAADVPAARALTGDLEAQPDEPEAGSWRDQVSGLRVTSAYAVWRIWFDRPIERADLTAFVITERRQALDSISFYERVVPEVRRWAATHDGCCLELHSYCVPDSFTDEHDLREALLDDLHHFLPELRGAGIVWDHWQWRRDFPAFHVGQYAARPTTRTGIPGLVLAGDWVKLPYPAMLMEAACTSGLIAANELMRAMGREGVEVHSVPRKGIFA
ncbi:MAG: lycopene cyclase domain-containing protein [Myxococcales bacterium FL481]|nr:MAG: lycopene cyclase domain-containing protein [Myxococcales bacterium FL481]